MPALTGPASRRRHRLRLSWIDLPTPRRRRASRPFAVSAADVRSGNRRRRDLRRQATLRRNSGAPILEARSGRLTRPRFDRRFTPARPTGGRESEVNSSEHRYSCSVSCRWTPQTEVGPVQTAALPDGARWAVAWLGAIEIGALRPTYFVGAVDSFDDVGGRQDSRRPIDGCILCLRRLTRQVHWAGTALAALDVLERIEDPRHRRPSREDGYRRMGCTINAIVGRERIGQERQRPWADRRLRGAARARSSSGSAAFWGISGAFLRSCYMPPPSRTSLERTPTTD